MFAVFLSVTADCVQKGVSEPAAVEEGEAEEGLEAEAEVEPEEEQEEEEEDDEEKSQSKGVNRPAQIEHFNNYNKVFVKCKILSIETICLHARACTHSHSHQEHSEPCYINTLRHFIQEVILARLRKIDKSREIDNSPQALCMQFAKHIFFLIVLPSQIRIVTELHCR